VKASVLLLALLASSAQAGSWSSWWLTPDQEGQRALKDGDPSRAARLFTDPQRRAYAQIEAKQYADGARSLAPLNDPESQYNRGNALTRAGDLSSALSAYDTALKRAPADSSLHRDAQHNRDLVAQQLKAQEKQQQGTGSQGGKSGQQDEKAGQQNGTAGQQNQGTDQQKQGTDQQNQGAGQQNQGAGQQNQGPGQQNQGPGQQNQGPGQQNQGAGQQDQKSSPSKAGDSPQSSPSTAGASDRSGGAPGQDRTDSRAQSAQPATQPNRGASDSADQARRDAEAALDHSRAPNAQGSEHPGQLGQAQTQADAARAARGASTLNGTEPERNAPRAPPPSEEALSMDQWLRQIPDDPAGLLRRKFLIEHMMKQGTSP
jgi:Ca-activated chloride channel homolog